MGAIWNAPAVVPRSDETPVTVKTDPVNDPTLPVSTPLPVLVNIRVLLAVVPCGVGGNVSLFGSAIAPLNPSPTSETLVEACFGSLLCTVTLSLNVPGLVGSNAIIMEVEPRGSRAKALLPTTENRPDGEV